MAGRVWLIRHGKTEWNKTGQYQGQTDSPLSAEGIAELVSANLCPAQVYVTPLCRTQETAAILFPNAKQIIVQDLQEMDFGVFEGRTYKDMENDADYRAWVDGGCQGRCPGGEDLPEFSARVCAAFEMLMAECGESDLVIVAHGGTQMAIMSRYTRPELSYFDGSTKNGGGFLLNAADWEKNKTLSIIERLNFTR